MSQYSETGGRPAPPMSRARIMAWCAGFFLLLIPLIGMQFTDEIDWGFADFIVAGVLIFGSLGAYELAIRKGGSLSYRLGSVVGIAGAFMLLWANGAVGITDGRADVLFPLVVLVGIVGAAQSRLKAGGMALTLVAMAATQVLIGVGALVLGAVPEFNSAGEILALTGFFAALFVIAAALYRKAANQESTS